MLAMVDANHAVHIYGDGSPPDSQKKVRIPTSEGFHPSEFDSLSEGSEEALRRTSAAFTDGGEAGELGDFLAPMMGAGGAGGGQQQVLVDIDDRWL